MTDRKTTKRALVVSALAILLCVTMLIGTTFAWFTDTKKTEVNTIKSGTLKLALEMVTGIDADGSETWGDATGTKLEFKKEAGHEGEEILWEPGCTYELPKLRIRNDGTLALKYKVVITGIDGNADLNDVIDWTIDDTVVGTDILLESGEQKEFTIKGHMQETANNDYQGKTIDGISITVYATQATVEYDSERNTYDENAQYDDVAYVGASDQGSLDDALAGSAGSEKPTYVDVSEGEYVLSGTSVLAGITISGEGTDKTVLKPEEKNCEFSGKNVTIKNVKIDGNETSSIDNNGVIKITGNNAVLDNVIAVGGGKNTYGHTVRVDVEAGSTTTIKNSSISGAFRGIQSFTLNGTLLIENTTLAPQCYCLNVDGGTGKLIVNNSILKGWTSYTSSVESAAFTGCTFEVNPNSYGYNCVRAYTNTTFVNCDFGDEFWFGAANNAVTVTFENCRYKGTLITESNVSDILEPTDNDKTTVVVK